MPDNLTYKKLNTFDDDARFFYQYFIQKGYSPVASAGIVGNLIQESTGGSGVDTTRKNGIGAFGAAQWLNDRKSGLFNFAKGMNLSPTDRRAQAEYLLYELNNTHTKAKNALMNAKTVDEATQGFLVHFEKPAKHEYVLDKRINYAKSVLPQQQSQSNSFWYDNYKVGKNDSGLKDNAFAVMNILKNKFPSLKVTSTVRNASQGVGKNSKTSRHNIGEAFDISGEHKDVYDYLNTYEGINLLNKYGLGVLDETDPETMKKTGATGAHYHIGADSKLVANTRAKMSGFDTSSMGMPMQDSQPEEYNGFKPTDNQLSNSYILDALDSLNEKLNKKNDEDIANMRNQELRASLLQKQQEKDFLVAQVLSVNLPFVERGY